jgi:heat shock protein HslJ
VHGCARGDRRLRAAFAIIVIRGCRRRRGDWNRHLSRARGAPTGRNRRDLADRRDDAGRLDKRHLYTVRAIIRSGSELLFASDIARAVITQGNPSEVDLILSRVDPTAARASGKLPGSSWILEDLNGAAVVADTRVMLDFAEKGRATGTGSCNRYFSTVEISGSSIRFGAVGATRMACATAVSLQEVKYFEALESSNRFTLEGDVLSIHDSASRPLRFRRAAS